MKTVLVMMAVTALSSAWIGCGGDDDDSAAADECTGTIPAYEDVSAFDKCVMCHDSSLKGATARMAAPADINFDTEDAAKAHAMKAAGEIEEGAMPPKNSGIKITKAEGDALVKWALCSD